MKKTTIWISPEGVPMVHPNGWPEKPKEPASNIYLRLYLDALAKAKEEAIELIAPGQFLAIAPSLKLNSFIEIEGEIESIQQMQGYDGKWVDCNVNMHNISWNTPLRQVARVKPAEAVSSESTIVTITMPQPSVRGKKYVINGEGWVPEDALTAQQINEECQKHNDELVKQLAEAKARIKELEDLFEDQHNWE